MQHEGVPAVLGLTAAGARTGQASNHVTAVYFPRGVEQTSHVLKVQSFSRTKDGWLKNGWDLLRMGFFSYPLWMAAIPGPPEREMGKEKGDRFYPFRDCQMVTPRAPLLSQRPPPGPSPDTDSPSFPTSKAASSACFDEGTSTFRISIGIPHPRPRFLVHQQPEHARPSTASASSTAPRS